jgi:DNA-directed RNA polymerase specialized sigma24 family protein
VEHELRVSGSTPGISPQRLAALNASLASLPESQRRLLRLRYTEGRSRVAVAVTIHRICQWLRLDLGGAGRQTKDDHLVMID